MHVILDKRPPCLPSSRGERLSPGVAEAQPQLITARVMTARARLWLASDRQLPPHTAPAPGHHCQLYLSAIIPGESHPEAQFFPNNPPPSVPSCCCQQVMFTCNQDRNTPLISLFDIQRQRLGIIPAA